MICEYIHTTHSHAARKNEKYSVWQQQQSCEVFKTSLFLTLQPVIAP